MEIRRCIGCMSDLGEGKGRFCPYCGYDNDADNPKPPCAMRPNTILHERYLVGRALGQGNLGITYIGFDLVLNEKVVLKEYFPLGSAAREGGRSNMLHGNSPDNTEQRQKACESFLREARRTAAMDPIPAVVRVRDTFYGNETAYIVMDYVEGIPLQEKLQKEGPMPFSDCVRLLRPLMEGLAKVHERGLIHRDISPDHIMVRPDGGAELLDLGAAGDMSVNRGLQSQPVTRNGFRSPEQYTEAGRVGPWTDIYALCATIYSCVTGKMLPSALDRINHPEIDFPADRKEALPVSARNALKDGLAVDPEKRIREMGGLLARLNGEEPKEEVPVEKKIRSISAAEILAAIVLLVCGVGACVNWLGRQTDSEVVKTGQGIESSGEEASSEPGEEEALRVERLGNSNANLLNGGTCLAIDQKYEYFMGADYGLYVCAWDQEDQTFYLEDGTRICDWGAYLNLGQDGIYFLSTDYSADFICRMDWDGSQVEAVYSQTDGKDLSSLQYALLSDGSEYLYY